MDNAIRNMMVQYWVTPETERFLLGEPRMYLNGGFIESEDKNTIDVIEPATASYLTSIPSATEADVDYAVGSARNALKRGPCVNRRRKLTPAIRLRSIGYRADRRPTPTPNNSSGLGAPPGRRQRATVTPPLVTTRSMATSCPDHG